MPKPRPLVRRLLPGLAAAALVALPGCTAGGGEQPGGSSAAEAAAPAPRTSYTADVPVLVPGAPGEPAATVAPGESGSYPDATAHGEADVTFVSDMIVHHEQALEMASLAPERAGSDAVRSLAERIGAAQGPEIQALRGWLEANGLPPPGDAGGADGADAGHAAHPADTRAAMPGMASGADLAALAAARGTDFDRRFLELMIRHHQGALEMAGDSGARARSALVQDVVSDVTVTQGVEIDRMRELLSSL